MAGWLSETDFVEVRGLGEGEADTWTDSGGSSANPARMYNFLLGGKDNFRADRDASERIAELMPHVVECARANRAFLRRAVAMVARSGVDQFLDIGAGLPSAGAVHEVARAIRPDARVVYVDNDPVVVRHAQALLATDDRTLAVGGDVRDPRRILTDPEVAGLLDLSRPVAVLLVAIMHFVTETEDPAQIVRTLRDVLAPGSYLVLSHGLDLSDREPSAAEAETNLEAARIYSQLAQPVRLRTHDEVETLLTGWDLVKPGLVPVSTWRPGHRPRRTPIPVLGGVARRPEDPNDA